MSQKSHALVRSFSCPPPKPLPPCFLELSSSHVPSPSLLWERSFESPRQRYSSLMCGQGFLFQPSRAMISVTRMSRLKKYKVGARERYSILTVPLTSAALSLLSKDRIFLFTKVGLGKECFFCRDKPTSELLC